eukprot:31550-Pelagococcus_subviridis.AAC.6
MNVRILSSSSGHTDPHTLRATSSTFASTPAFSASFNSFASVSTRDRTDNNVFDTMKPVDGCTIPAVPPIPSVRCGSVGSTLPMGIKQYSSSSTRFTHTPSFSSLCRSFTLRSSNSNPGRSTRLVSSKKICVSENGIAYRNVGCSSFIARCLSSKCESRQSMNNIVSSGNPCGSSVSHMIPNATWYPGLNSRSNSTSRRACPVASSTSLLCTSIG